MYWTLELVNHLEDAPWPATKDELIEFGHDLYIICSNNSKPHNLYQNNNGFLFRDNESRFGKLFYKGNCR